MEHFSSFAIWEVTIGALRRGVVERKESTAAAKMEDNDLFAIDISSDESATESTKTKAPRDFQSEADFLATLAAYKPNVQAGEVRLSPFNVLTHSSPARLRLVA